LASGQWGETLERIDGLPGLALAEMSPVVELTLVETNPLTLALAETTLWEGPLAEINQLAPALAEKNL